MTQPVKASLASLDEEEQRAAREELAEEELAIFDLFTTPEPKLTNTQGQEVKRGGSGTIEEAPGTRGRGRLAKGPRDPRRDLDGDQA
jgi:hypothetical protein